MEEGETASMLSRKELRKQKLTEYLAAKGKLKEPNPRPYLRDDSQVKKPVTSAPKAVTGKENKTSGGRFSYERTKVPILPAQSTVHPARRVFGINNTGNVKGSILTGQQKTNFRSAPSHSAQAKLKPVVTVRYTVNTTSHLKKQSTTGIQSLGKAPTNASCTAVTKSNSRFSSSSKTNWSCPMTVFARLSLGPLVKTKTGLVPAVILPRSQNLPKSQNLTHTSIPTDTTSSASYKLQSRSSTSVTVPKRSAIAQKKTLPTAVLKNPVSEKKSSTAGVKIKKAQDQNKSDSKLLLGRHSRPSCTSQLSSGLKSTSHFSKSTKGPVTTGGTVEISKHNKSVGQLTDRFPKQRSELEGEKNGQQYRVPSQTSSGPASRCSSKAADRVMQPAMAEKGGETKTYTQRDSKKGHSLINAQPPQMRVKRTNVPVMSQTVPQPARTISRTSQARDTKTAKVPTSIIPQTEGKKQTAAQEERMRKLQEWREAKGISYKRPPMPVKPQVKCTPAMLQPFWATMKEEDEAHSLICAVDRSLADCIKLLGEGCPPEQVKVVLSRLPPVSQKFAKYWICQARLMEKEGNLDVLSMFEKAVGVVLEPVDELRTVVFEILKKKDEIQASDNDKEEDQIPAGEMTPENINNPMMTPKPMRALICGEKGDSSVVKYKITATPGGPPSQQKKPPRINGQEVRFFTPVRRSVRIERASLRYPASLQEHDLCVASYSDMIAKEEEETSEEQQGCETSPSANNTPLYVYRQNEALQDKVLVQLVCEEGI